MPELTDAELEAKWGGAGGAAPAAEPPEPIATNAIPLTTDALANTVRNAPPAVGDTRRRQESLGERQGVKFHEEGLPTWADIMAKSRETMDAKIRYLAGKFGTENVRLNDLHEPVVTIKNPETGQPEDYPMNPHQLTVRSLTGLARFAPDVAGAIVAEGLLPNTAGTFLKAVATAAGMEAGGAARDIGVQIGQPAPLDLKRPLTEHLEQLPMDAILNLGIAGAVKGAQAVAGIGAPKFLGGSGINIPNPIAGTPLVAPARPALTREGVEAAQRLQSLTGISPELRPSETTGIPLMAMLEQYMERKPAGAAPQIAAGEKREAASKAIQNWMVDPSTLQTDEAVGRGALNALQGTVAPYQTEAALATTAKEAVESRLPALNKEEMAAAAKIAGQQLEKRQQAAVLSAMRVSDLPQKGLDLAPTGDLLRTKAIQARDEFKQQASDLYDKFYNNPKAKAPIVGGETLKNSIDDLISDLPKVTKQVEEPAFDAYGNPTTRSVEQQVPISTPIRPRLEELSAKLADGKVSINDLKQVRTDLNDAIKVGEAIPGVKEGRLKATEAAVTDAITQGLAEIGDKDLSQAWKDATTFYRDNVEKFMGKRVSPLFREADQSSSVGNAEFTKRAITNPDAYSAISEFYGLKSPEMAALRDTARKKVLADSVAPGGLIDGANLVRQLESMRNTNPSLFKEAFANKGDAIISAANQLGEWQTKVPVEAVDKMLNARGIMSANQSYLQGKIVAMQTAQKRLNQEYQNQIISKFLKGDSPIAELQPDKFVSSLPQAKLSDVKDVMNRLETEAPDVAEQVRRKSVQNLLSEARRTPTPTDTMAKLNGEPGDLVSGIGIANALGKGDQLEKYKALLGNLYEPLSDYARMELLGEERSRISRGVGMLAPGSAMNQFIKALTPWENPGSGGGITKELAGLARDKIVSIALSSEPLRKWLVSPYALKDASGAIKWMMVSQPFLRGMHEEFKNADEYAKTLSILKVAFGTAARPANPLTQPTGGISDQDLINKYSPKP